MDGGHATLKRHNQSFAQRYVLDERKRREIKM
jgi:hypothetical protein